MEGGLRHRLGWSFDLGVKNWFSNQTKVQIGQDQFRIAIMNDHQEKALR